MALDDCLQQLIAILLTRKSNVNQITLKGCLSLASLVHSINF